MRRTDLAQALQLDLDCHGSGFSWFDVVGHSGLPRGAAVPEWPDGRVSRRREGSYAAVEYSRPLCHTQKAPEPPVGARGVRGGGAGWPPATPGASAGAALEGQGQP
ncbi:hypothetical protein Sm713_19090 [Streptomyces sp. TS71-3]|nr:hypothetical protein Sm713_19090 [Streptomyces sp. TS71-3]